MLMAVLKSVLILIGGLIFSGLCSAVFADPTMEYIFIFAFIAYMSFVVIMYLNMIIKK